MTDFLNEGPILYFYDLFKIEETQFNQEDNPKNPGSLARTLTSILYNSWFAVRPRVFNQLSGHSKNYLTATLATSINGEHWKSYYDNRVYHSGWYCQQGDSNDAFVFRTIGSVLGSKKKIRNAFLDYLKKAFQPEEVNTDDFQSAYFHTEQAFALDCLHEDGQFFSRIKLPNLRDFLETTHIVLVLVSTKKACKNCWRTLKKLANDKGFKFQFLTNLLRALTKNTDIDPKIFKESLLCLAWNLKTFKITIFSREDQIKVFEKNLRLTDYPGNLIQSRRLSCVPSN